MGNQNSSKENDVLNIHNQHNDKENFNSQNKLDEKRVKQLKDYSYFKDNISYNGISSEFSSPKTKENLDKINANRRTFIFQEQSSTDEERSQFELKEKKEITKPNSNVVPTSFEWREAGENVYLTGSFVNWDQKFLLRRNLVEHKFEICLELPKGRYEYKFVVDEIWKFSKFHPTIRDNRGNINNIIDNSNFATISQTSTSSNVTNNIVNEEKKSENSDKIYKNYNCKENEKENYEKRMNNEDNFQNYFNRINLNKSKKPSKVKEEYLSNIPRKVELNTDATVCPDSYRDFYNINISSRQTSLGQSDHLSFTDTVYGAGNTSFLSIAAPSHVNLNHACTKMINNKRGVIITSSSQRTDEKILTIIYYRPLHVIKSRNMSK
jgi:hypothetical protein